MKKIIVYSFLIFFGFSAIIAQANPKDSRYPFIGQIKAKRVNIRSGPHINFEILGKTKKGDKVTIVGKRQGWYKVRLPKTIPVYVHYELVQRRTEPAGIVKGSRVNARAKPNIKATLVGQLNKGEIVTIRGLKNEWLEITPTANCSAWISTDFIDYVKPGLAKEPEPRKIVIPKHKKKTSKCRDCAKKKDSPLAKGIVEDSGRLINKRSLAKLIDDKGNIKYFLDAEKKLLDTYGNSRVAIWGEVVKDKNYSAPIIKVHKIILIE